MTDATAATDQWPTDTTLFDRYALVIRALPAGPLSAAAVQIPALRMEAAGNLATYYAPFDAVNPEARVILLGITPGLTQMTLALERARTLLLAGRPPDEVVREAKRTAAFGGTMRAHLVRMLDDIGLPQRLGIDSSERLFDQAAGLAHMTSALRYPVFFRGQNYTGGQPKMTRDPLLRRRLLTTLADEVAQVPGALIVPLGKSVSEALAWLDAQGRVDLRRCLVGFPHPSGGNGHREREYAERREALAAQVAAWFGGEPLPQPLPSVQPAVQPTATPSATRRPSGKSDAVG